MAVDINAPLNVAATLAVLREVERTREHDHSCRYVIAGECTCVRSRLLEQIELFETLSKPLDYQVNNREVTWQVLALPVVLGQALHLMAGPAELRSCFDTTGGLEGLTDAELASIGRDLVDNDSFYSTYVATARHLIETAHGFDPEHQDEVEDEVKNYAASLVASGAMVTFAAIFGSADPTFDVVTLGPEQLQEIYDQYIREEDDGADDDDSDDDDSGVAIDNVADLYSSKAEEDAVDPRDDF